MKRGKSQKHIIAVMIALGILGVRHFAETLTVVFTVLHVVNTNLMFSIIRTLVETIAVLLSLMKLDYQLLIESSLTLEQTDMLKQNLCFTEVQEHIQMMKDSNRLSLMVPS